MTITGALVLFAVIWFIVFFVVLQVTMHSQEDAGEVQPGTPPGAPADAQILRRAKVTTVIATVIFAATATVILSDWITLRDLDIFNRMDPPDAD